VGISLGLAFQGVWACHANDKATRVMQKNRMDETPFLGILWRELN
jgi:hypothetical protein